MALDVSSDASKLVAAKPEVKSEKEELMYSEMIPQDLLFALTEVNSILKAKQEELAPVKTLKTPKEMRVPHTKGAPDSLWHHRNRRLNFHHLTKHPRSDGKTAGSRDISFLYDVSAQTKPPPKTSSSYDKSATRLEALRDAKSSASNLAVPDSIIPDEYHIVKSKAVIGLDYADDSMTTNLVDKEKALRVFPSLKPTKRFEVVQLMKTMDQMLSKAGVDDVENEAKGPTQIHNLLEIIKKEQQIYDIVFHEVIRQASIECVERGQLLSKLRQRYADLLNRIPRQIKSLHSEVMAQRSLDRRLTEELLRFKSSIGNLTDELIAVREHDKKITKEAEIAQTDLAEALKESQKNANLVDEYHDLYELQRHRLESQTIQLTNERDLWCNAAYSLALKIIAENTLSTIKRLHVTEKAWHKLAGHFNVMISDHDTESLVQLQKHVEEWRELIFNFHQVLEATDKSTSSVLTTIKEGIHNWVSIFQDTLIGYIEDTGFRTFKLPSTDMIESLQSDIAQWEMQLGENSERFGGDTLLSNQELLIKMTREVDCWTDVGIAIYDRHRSDSGESYHLRKVMSDNSELFHRLKKQMDVRITGENGTAKGMISLQNSLDVWNSRIVVSMRGAEVVTDNEWLKFYDAMVDYEASLTETINSIRSVTKEGQSDSEEDRVTVEEAITNVQKWLKDTVNGIEGENGKMSAQITSVHTRMVHWMVQVLLLLAPDKGNKIPSEESLMAGCSLEELTKKCQDLSDHLSRITAYLCQCVNGIVQMVTQHKKDLGEDDADHELRDFRRLKSECKEWIRTCQLLLNTQLENPITLLDDTVLARLDLGKFASKDKESDKQTSEEKDKEQPQETEHDILQDSEKKTEKIEDVSAAEATKQEDLTEADPKLPDEEGEDSQTKSQQSFEVIGADENVTVMPLGEAQEGDLDGTVASPTRPSSDLTQNAYDAIAKLDQLQKLLVLTEERAQGAEMKSIQLEEDLNAAHKQIRALERKLADEEKASSSSASTPKPTEQKPADDKPTTSDKHITEASTKPQTPEAGKRVSSRAGTDKKKGKSKKK